MSNIKHFWIGLILALAVVSFGSDKQPKATYSSPRRVLAIKLIPAIPGTAESSRTKFLYNTNSEEGDIMPGSDGQFGNFRGNISVITLSSNATVWRAELTFVGTISGSSLHQTNVLEIPFPESRQLSLGQIGSVTCLFLSDEQQADFDKGLLLDDKGMPKF